MLPIHAAFWRSRMQGRLPRARLLSHASQIFCAFTVWRVKLRARARPEPGSALLIFDESCIVELPWGCHFLFCTSILRVVFFLPRDACCWQVLDFDESCIVDVPVVCHFWLCTSMLHAVFFLLRNCCCWAVHPVHHQASTKTTFVVLLSWCPVCPHTQEKKKGKFFFPR